METVVIRKPSLETIRMEYYETECLVGQVRRVCTAPPDFNEPPDTGERGPIPSMKTVASLISPRFLLAGITFLSSVALSSSLYLQYVEGYQPCVYCYVLRYLTLGMLAASLIEQFAPNLIGDVWVLYFKDHASLIFDCRK